jgi:hypothetical protein
LTAALNARFLEAAVPLASTPTDLGLAILAGRQRRRRFGDAQIS